MFKLVIPALAALSLCAPAQAKEFAEAAVIVQYADLDLSSAAGAAKLQARIGAAVNAVCDRPFIRDLKAMGAWEKCRAEASQGAFEQVAEAGSPLTLASLNR